MSIKLIEAIGISGQHQPVGTQLTLSAAQEADLVQSHKAVYVVAPFRSDWGKPVISEINPTTGGAEFSIDGKDVYGRILKPLANSGMTLIWSAERDGLTGIAAQGGTCTIDLVTQNGEPAVRVTGTGIAQAQVDLNISANPVSFHGGIGALVESDTTRSANLTLLGSADVGFAAFVQGGYAPAAYSAYSSTSYQTVGEFLVEFHAGGAVADIAFSPGYQGTWATTPPTYPTELNMIRFRFVNQPGRIPLGYIKKIFVINPRKSRVTISIDDGYASAYRFLKPVLDKYNLKASWGIITDKIGANSTYMKRRDVQDLYAQGHEPVVHGPIGVDGNIVDNYIGDADPVAAAMADVMYHKNNLISWGVLPLKSQKVYAWPQGKHQRSIDDLAYHVALREKGFTLARSASIAPYSMSADTWPNPLLLPIVGHSQKTSSVLEAANITDLVNRVNDAALRGTDLHLMFHAGVGSTDVSWGSNATLNIRNVDFDAICAALNTNIKAGTQDCVVLGDLA